MTTRSILDKMSRDFFGGSRGNTLQTMGRNKDALRDFNKAIQIDPRYISAYLNRGVVLTIMGDKKAALRDYNKIIGLKPTEALAYANRGGLFFKSDKRRALADFKKFLQLAPRHPGASRIRALIDSIKKELNHD